MNATAAPPASIVRPFLMLAAMAFAIGFLGVMAVSGTLILAELGQLSPYGVTATASAAEPSASPATVSGAASDDWNFPKKI